MFWIIAIVIIAVTLVAYCVCYQAGRYDEAMKEWKREKEER